MTFSTPPRVRSGGQRSRQKQVTSFSRELSRRPLEVLRSHPVRVGGERGTEGETSKDQVGHLPPTQSKTPVLTQSDALSDYHPQSLLVPDSHFPPEAGNAARRVGSISNVRYPYGNPVVPRVPHRVSCEDSPLLSNKIAQPMALSPNKPRAAAESTRGKVDLISLDNTLLVSPRSISFRTGVAGNNQSAPEAQGRNEKASHVVRMPRQNALPPSARPYTNRPFSEELSTTAASPEVSYLGQERHESSHGPSQAIRQNPVNEAGMVSRELEGEAMDSICRSPCVSPDYMHVGAQITGNQLVLLNEQGQIVHQLTEADLDANPASSESCTDERYAVSSPLELPVTDPAPQSLPPPPSRLTGTRPPPPTAADGVRAHELLHGNTTKDSDARTDLEENSDKDSTSTCTPATETDTLPMEGGQT